jgi:hypothetical protein
MGLKLKNFFSHFKFMHIHNVNQIIQKYVPINHSKIPGSLVWLYLQKKTFPFALTQEKEREKSEV